MLTSRNGWSIVGRAACKEIANLAAQSDKTPEMDVNSAAEVKRATIQKPRRCVHGAVEQIRALLIQGIPTSQRKIRRHARSRKHLHAYSGRHVQRGDVPRCAP